MLSKKSKKIEIGDKVLVVVNKAVQELEIVDLLQGDLKSGKVSFLSPIAKAILGHRYPERVVVKLPNGKDFECQLIRPVH